MKLLVIDGNSIANRAFYGIKMLTTKNGQYTNAIYGFINILHRLEEPYKEVFGLRVFGELSYSQIAEIFGKSESWARVTYHRAKLKIQERMNEKNE